MSQIEWIKSLFNDTEYILGRNIFLSYNEILLLVLDVSDMTSDIVYIIYIHCTDMIDKIIQDRIDRHYTDRIDS